MMQVQALQGTWDGRQGTSSSSTTKPITHQVAQAGGVEGAGQLGAAWRGCGRHLKQVAQDAEGKEVRGLLVHAHARDGVHQLLGLGACVGEGLCRCCMVS